MIQAADVAKLRCRFVKAVYDTIQKRKYTTTYCWDVAQEYYLDYKLAAIDFTDLDCDLTGSQECSLIDKGDNSSAVVLDCTAASGYSCGSQINLTLEQISNDTYEYRARSSNAASTNSFPDVVLNTNSIAHTARFYSKIDYRKNGGAWTNISSTSTAYNNLTPYRTIQLDNITDIPNGFLQDCRIKLYDNGVITELYTTPTPLSFYISYPSSAFDGSPSPYNIPSADLYFGSPNYSTAFGHLMENVLHFHHGFPPGGSTSKFAAAVNPFSGIVVLSSVLKHGATGQWASFGKGNFYTNYWAGNTTKASNNINTYMLPVGDIYYGGAVTWSPAVSTITSFCGTVGALVTNPGTIYGIPISNLSDVNFVGIVGNGNSTSPAPVVTVSGASGCEAWSFLATIDAMSAIASYRWKTGGGTTLATTLNYSTSTSGTYYFEVVLTNGCTITKSISTVSDS